MFSNIYIYIYIYIYKYDGKDAFQLKNIIISKKIQLLRIY